MKNDMMRNIVLIAALLMGFYLLSQATRSLSPSASETLELSYSDLMSHAENRRVRTATVDSTSITGELSDGTPYRVESAYVLSSSAIDVLREGGAEVNSAVPRSRNSFLDFIIAILPTLVIVGIIIFMWRQMQGAAGRGLGIGRSRAKTLNEETQRVTFADVAGVDEAKQEVSEIVEFLRDPTKFQRLGGRIPKGVLMVGPPGTGKTLLARSIAGEANVPFFSISGSDFVEMFVGVGASRVRDMFEQAKKNSPCIIFIDEIDAVGRARGQGFTGGHEEREQTLNQLLVEMDGFEPNEGIILIAATNRADVLDKALLRPGRFDRQVQVNLPDVHGREAILKVHINKNKVPLGADVDLARIAKGTATFSGADIENLVNEAALLAARANKTSVNMDEFEDAKDKITMGPARKSQARTPEEIELVAYHEGGHAIVGLQVPLRDRLNKLTIIPRGGAGGYAQFLPEKDSMFMTRENMEAMLAMSFGGRLAEELVYGPDKVTNGASMDIRQATGLARAMVEEWGLSEKVGMLYAGRQQEGFMVSSTISSRSQALVDEEVQQLLDAAEARARQILSDNIEGLHRLKDALLEYETLSAEEVETVLAGSEITRQPSEVTPDSTDSTPQPATGRPKIRSGLPKIGGAPTPAE
jgi:cell division protease FtsH